jgi:hypothetical protein
MSFHRHLTVTIETQEDSTIIKTYPKIKKQRLMYAIVQGKNVYVRILEKYNTHMYTTVKQKPVYMCQNISRLRRRLKKSDSE